MRKAKFRKFSCTAYLVTPLDLVTVFWLTKCVTKSGVHCTGTDLLSSTVDFSRVMKPSASGSPCFQSCWTLDSTKVSKVTLLSALRVQTFFCFDVFSMQIKPSFLGIKFQSSSDFQIPSLFFSFLLLSSFHFWFSSEKWLNLHNLVAFLQYFYKTHRWQPHLPNGLE